MDKFKVSEHIDFEALIDVREFVLKIEDWELPLLTKKNKVHEEKLLYKYEGVKFTDDDEVRACPSPPTLTPRPSLAVDHLHHLLEGLAYTGTGKSKGHQVLAMEDNDEDDDDAQPYLINQTLIDMIRATAQDERSSLWSRRSTRRSARTSARYTRVDGRWRATRWRCAPRRAVGAGGAAAYW